MRFRVWENQSHGCHIRFLAIELLCFLLFLLCPLTVQAEDVTPYVDGILSVQTGGASVQEWIDNELTEQAGVSAEWYIFALRQSSGHYDFSSYTAALRNYVQQNEVYSATSRLKYALLFAAVGEDTPYITETLENSIGQQGVMSWIYGLHLLNNNYTCSISAEDAVHQLLSMQLEDGGWAVMGTVGDIDVTAMALQALAPHAAQIPDAIDRALAFLSDRQLSYGGYQSFGTENLESTAQVVTALSALGMDAFAEERFQKDGHTLLNGMERFRLPDGSFSHVENGGYNTVATVQAFYTFIAYQRMQNGQTPLYILEPSEIPVQTEPAAPGTELPELSPTVQEAEMLEEPVTEPAQNPASIAETAAPALETEPGTSDAAASITMQTVIYTTSSTFLTETTVTAVTTTSSLPAQTTASPETTTQTTSAEIVTTEKIRPISSETAKTEPETLFSSWKLPALCILIGITLTSCLILWIIGKRNGKNFLFIGVLTLAGTGIILLLRIETPEEYYHTEHIPKENAVGTITMTIRCDTVLGKSDAAYIPADGVILQTTEFEIAEDDTAFDLLTEAVRVYGIQMEHNGNGYVSGIQYLYELQFGDLSGWMYRVNDTFPSVGCTEFVLHDGDCVEWLYTCDIGNDLTQEGTS